MTWEMSGSATYRKKNRPATVMSSLPSMAPRPVPAAAKTATEMMAAASTARLPWLARDNGMCLAGSQGSVIARLTAMHATA